MTINIISLGCSKNLVDSEKLMRQFRQNGHKCLIDSDKKSDAVIINTCGFVLDAKTESVHTILEALENKKNGLTSKVFVMGCLSERYKKELPLELPEVDGFFGVNDFPQILQTLHSNYEAGLLLERIQTTPAHYAYLKISEGCNLNCAFCAIPAIRGKQISVPITDLVKEAGILVRNGTKELLLIAQDLTNYGSDLYKKKMLPELIRQLSLIPGLMWIRLHYAHPGSIMTGELISLMKENPLICRYLDIPFQHCNDRILKRMNRGHTKSDIIHIINRFRTEIPDVAIRTTLITGFPGETKEEFDELLQFVEEMKFDRLGVFTYSHEENTPAAVLSELVPEKTALQRKEILMKAQEKISLEKNLALVRGELEAIIDGTEGEFILARSRYDSPGVDNEILIPATAHQDLVPGSIWKVRITDALEYDLFAEPVEKL